LKNKKSFRNRLDVLEPLLIYYPKSDSFYIQIQQKVVTLQKQYNTYIENIYNDYAESLVSRIVRFDQLPDIDPAVLYPDLTNYYREHYFDSVDLTDTMILYTPVVPSKVLNFLALYLKQGVSKEQQEENFIAAVDGLMQHMSKEKKIQEQVINYLIDGFQMYGFEKVMTYLVENYVLENSCVGDQKEEELRKRIEGFKKMAIGNTVNDFTLFDRDGNEVRLSNAGAEYTVLFFWASWCPHCGDAIGDMKNLYEENKGKIEIIGVSVDSDGTAWLQALNDKQMAWPNVAELQGWDGKTVNDYYVYATPTFFLIDKNLAIVAKPTSVSELEQAIDALKL